MTEFWNLLWQLNINFSLLLLVILAARFFLRKATGVYNAYNLWIALPLGLVAALVAHQIEVANPPLAELPIIISNYVAASGAAATGQTIQVLPQQSWAHLELVWLAGALILLLRLVWQHVQLRRELADLTATLEYQLNSSYPILGINKPSFSPAVYGFIRPTIYFPNHLFNELESEQIGLIIRHEEQHIKQKHLWLNLVWDVLVCCMWFNPLLYIGRQKFRHDQELFCDYLVLNDGNEEQQKSYGLALLSTIGANHSVSLLCSWQAFNQLEERIMNLKQKSTLFTKVATVVGTLLVTLAASIYGVSAKEQSASPSKSLALPQESFHVEHLDDQWQIEWDRNGQQFMREDNEYFVVESGQKRSMKDAERRKLEQKLETSEINRFEASAAERLAREAQSEARREQSELRQEQREKDQQARIRERQSQRAMLSMERATLAQQRSLANRQKRHERETQARAAAKHCEAETELKHAEQQLSLLHEKHLMPPTPAESPELPVLPEKAMQPSSLPSEQKKISGEPTRFEFDPSVPH